MLFSDSFEMRSEIKDGKQTFVMKKCENITKNCLLLRMIWGMVNLSA